MASVITYRNESRNFLVPDYIDRDEAIMQLGCTRSQARRIILLEFDIVWAQRPINCVGVDEHSEWQFGEQWEAWTSAGHGFFVAARPEWRSNVFSERTLVEHWNDYDAYPVRLVSEGVLKSYVITALAKHDIPYEDELAECNGDLVRLASRVGFTVHDRVAQ